MKSDNIYYGWWIVLSCFVITLYTSGVCLFGFTTLFKPLNLEFGWSHAQIAFASSLQCLTAMISSPVLGMLVDRWKPRRLIMIGITISFIGMMIMSNTHSLNLFYLSYILIALGYNTCSYITLMTVLVIWFRQKVSLATGIVSVGTAFGNFIVPLETFLIDTLGWRMAIMMLGIGLLVIPLPLSFIVRDKPSAIDNEISYEHKTTTDKEPDSVKKPESNIKTNKILKNSTFWLITIASMLQFMVVYAVLIHIMPFLDSVGISRSISGILAGFLSIPSIPGRLLFGWIGDRFNKKIATVITFALCMAGIFSFGCVVGWGLWLIAPAFIFFGLGWGGQSTLTSPLLSEYFGRSNFGTIYSITWCAMQAAGLISTYMAGWVFDNLGSYQGIWFALTGLALISVILLVTIPSSSKVHKKLIG